MRLRLVRVTLAVVLVLGAALVVAGAGAARATVATITLTASSLTPAPGENVTLTATVVGGSDADKIRFTKDGTPFATVAIVGGVATTSIIFAPGASDIQALYLVGGSYPNGVASNVVSVGSSSSSPHTTTTTLTTSTVVPGATATFTATVAQTGGGGSVPAGAVTFLDNGVRMGDDSVPLVDGVAILSWGGFSEGSTHEFTARYEGDEANAPSTSAPIGLTIPGIPPLVTSVEVVATPNPVAPGGTTSLRAHVFQSGGIPALSSPVGQVAFRNDVTHALLGTVTLGSDGWTAPLVLGGLPAGDYRILATYEGDATFPAASAATNLTFSAAVATVTAPSPTIVYGAPQPSLAPSYSNGVPPATPATCTTTATASSPAGTYPVTCSGAADPGYAYAYAQGTLTITKAPLTVTANSVTIPRGAVPVLTATITGFVNGENASTAGISGTAACSSSATSGSAPGSYPVMCAVGTLASDRYAFASFVPGTVTIAGVRTLTVTAPSPTIVYGVAIPTLTPTYAGFDPGDSPASLATAPTCTTTATATSTPGAYPVTCTAGSDSRYAFVYTSGALTISKAATTLVVIAPPIAAVGKPVVLRAFLSSGLHPIAGASVTLTLGGDSCDDTTNWLGVAQCTLTPTRPLGPTSAKATFAGDARYDATSDTGPVLLYAFAGSGCSFVVGDESATPGAHVTFWGSQWSKQNSLSDGDAPSAFKGFATASDVGVGGRWTAPPGNSAQPPGGPLPTYLGVLVTRSASKSGSTIGGTILGIAIVKVDPGYDRNPGHPGTGTIVA